MKYTITSNGISTRTSMKRR